MKRRCLTCQRLIDSGSYCKAHSRRWKPDPDRVRGARALATRSRVIERQGGRCAGCGRAGVPLEVHHRDHDERNDDQSNLVALCRSCHRKAELQ